MTVPARFWDAEGAVLKQAQSLMCLTVDSNPTSPTYPRRLGTKQILL
jgi:hypothetical protein